MHQEREYPEHVIATDPTNQDLVAWAESFGAFAARVERIAEFPAALEAALRAGREAPVELRIDPEPIATRAALAQVRGAGAAGA